ncbi:MAG: hypothetical protein QMD09_08145 [Desulfatibacillaceae bacterium]|nr:hypothetical protein [Desulfatibacillaceae bacterium]
MISLTASISLAKKKAGSALKLLPVVFACFFLLAASAQAIPFANQWEWDNPPLFGKPRLIEESGGQQVLKISYGQDGKRQKIDVLSLRGEALAVMAFEYDSSGSLVEIQVYQAHNPHPLREKAQYENGRIVKMTGPHFPTIAAFEYDESGRLDKIIVLDDKGQQPTAAHWLYGWNDNDKLVSTSFYGLDEKLMAKEEFEYNDKGFVSSRSVYGTEGTIIERREYEYRYDKTGNWTSRTTTRITWADGVEKSETATVSRKISYY